jgi:hypothetical protein
MSTYLRPTELAKYLDVAPQKISQLRARGIITPEQDGSYEADATRVAYIRNLRAHVVPAASASLTEERALLLRARRARMELETARMRGGTITPEEDERRLEMIRSRLEDIPALHELGQGFYRPYLRGLLAEAHADGGNLDIALAELDDVLTEASTMDQHFSDAELHRIRGEILLKRDPINTRPAEEAFLTAIAVAQQQKARSFELRAALSLAKLYQSTGRVAEAHAVLAPALQSFSPTPEFLEIEEAQTLLAALA